jgi:hypothetical protein
MLVKVSGCDRQGTHSNVPRTRFEPGAKMDSKITVDAYSELPVFSAVSRPSTNGRSHPGRLR